MPSLLTGKDGDSSDSDSDSDDDDVIVEDVLEGDEDLEDLEDVIEDAPSLVSREEADDHPLGRGLRTKRKPTSYEPSLKGQKYGDGFVNLTYRGNKYKMRDGVIHLNIEDVPPPVPMDDEELDNYIMGVILIHQYNLKKGIELFGDKAEDQS